MNKENEHEHEPEVYVYQLNKIYGDGLIFTTDQNLVDEEMTNLLGTLEHFTKIIKKILKNKKRLEYGNICY